MMISVHTVKMVISFVLVICTLCHQVITGLIRKEITRHNLALHKPAIQSSTFDWVKNQSHEATLAVDGILGGKETCSYTDDNFYQVKSAWWEVDLQKLYRLGDIRILNSDHRAERLHDLRIEVSETTGKTRTITHCTTKTGVAGPGWLNLSCDSSVTGRHVRITKRKNDQYDILSLCEVEIYEAQGTIRTMHYSKGRSPTIETSGHSLMTKSFLHCGTICSRTEDCRGFILMGMNEKRIQCDFLTGCPTDKKYAEMEYEINYYYNC